VQACEGELSVGQSSGLDDAEILGAAARIAAATYISPIGMTCTSYGT
jgi:hypothetical protein